MSWTRPTLVPKGWTITCDSIADGHGFDHGSLDKARECTWKARAADAVTAGKVTYDNGSGDPEVVLYLAFSDYPLGGMDLSTHDPSGWDLGDPSNIYGADLTVTGY